MNHFGSANVRKGIKRRIMMGKPTAAMLEDGRRVNIFESLKCIWTLRKVNKYASARGDEELLK